MKHLVKKIKVCLVLAAAVLALSSISAMASEDDNSLSSLGILTEGAVVTPEFSYDTWSYEVSVPAGTTELQLDPVPSSASATITDISGTVLNEDGTGYVTITVQAGNGSPFTYELHVTADGAAAAGEEVTEAATEPQTETETEPETETEVETEDPQYVRVDRNSLQEAENTITDLKDEITRYRDNMSRLTMIMYVLIGLSVILLFVMINLLLKKKDMKAELNDYRSYGYSEPDRKEQKTKKKAKKNRKDDDFFDGPEGGQGMPGGYSAGSRGAADGQIQSFYDPKAAKATGASEPGPDAQPQKSQKKPKKMPHYEKPAGQPERGGNPDKTQAPSSQEKQPARGGKGGKKGDVEINMIDL